MLWRMTVLGAGVVGIAAALWHDRFVLALLLFLVTLGLAWLLRLPPTTHAQTAGSVRQPPATRAAPLRTSGPDKPETAITLWAANEHVARQLVEDQYYLLGVLMSEPSDTMDCFRDALGQGGVVSGRAAPNLSKGGYDVRLTVAKAPSPPTTAGDYTGPPIAELTQSALVEELVKAGVDRERAEADVQVSIVGASVLDRAQIQAIHLSDQPLMVKDLAMRWAAHCVYHGSKANRG